MKLFDIDMPHTSNDGKQSVINFNAACIEEIFRTCRRDLSAVVEIAHQVKKTIQAIDPFIQQNTSAVCPRCQNACCTNKHAYYNYEDLVYIYALGLRPPEYIYINDNDPCQFLSHRGCVLERAIRPSGCNWYFCNYLFDRMEQADNRAYYEFDCSLQDSVDLWLELIKEFGGKYAEITGYEIPARDFMRNVNIKPAG